MRRLLLVTHRAIDQAGGPAARWRSFVRHLPAAGWRVDVVSAAPGTGAEEFAADERGREAARRRASVMGAAGRLADPAFALLGLRPEALPLSMAWLPRGTAAVRRRLAAEHFDAVLATGPPMVALLATALATRGHGTPPLVVELRDLWAANPAFDRGGPVLPALERATFARASVVIACTPEAVADLQARHPDAGVRMREVPNGFEDELLLRRAVPSPSRPITILHSGTLTADRPLAPLLRVLAEPPYRGAFRLVLHGYAAPAVEAEIGTFGAAVDIERPPPSDWADAVDRIARADVALVTQGRGAGDATAVASKVYEYLALGRPVLCVTDGGATEALLRRLGADSLVARLDREETIAAALDRLLAGDLPAPVAPGELDRYTRRATAAELAAILDEVVAAAAVRTGRAAAGRR